MTAQELNELLGNAEVHVGLDNLFSYNCNEGAMPLDPYTMPLDTVSDLAGIDKTHRYIGMTITVLNTDGDGIPVDYQLMGGINNSNWRVKRQKTSVANYAALSSLKSYEIYKGLEITVLSDENSEPVGKDGEDNYIYPMVKYWVVDFDSSKNPIWERQNNGGGVEYTAGDGIEINGNTISSFVKLNIEEGEDEMVEIPQ